MTDNIEYLRSWADDIRKSSGACVDADKLDAIAKEIGDLRAGLRVDPDLATAAIMAGGDYWRRRTEKAEAALREAREFVAADLKGTLECVCVLDKDTLEPIESTIDPPAVPHVESIRAVLARIDAALKGGAE